MSPDHYHHHQHQHRGTVSQSEPMSLYRVHRLLDAFLLFCFLILKRINANCHYGKKKRKHLTTLCHLSLVSLYLLSKRPICDL
jgi:hypothetical protein